ncbi:hypothetical protein C900_01689 [Fulvivirga imtechensis AK7]|uniref:Outer membrane lipoprotein-sorting protein n=2 Tax=Fulvivirga TaxID=396811 RepID=L8JXE1_9BACT|nr:hypothetical protein C900_01689 [Fulvivirga imtechensis AK7]
MKFLFISLIIFLLVSTCDYRHKGSFDVDNLVKKMTEGSGGDSAIASIKTHVSKYVRASNSEVQEISVVTFKRPAKIRFDIFDNNNVLLFTIATNGGEGWVYLPNKGVFPAHQKKTNEMISWAEHWIDEWRKYKDIDLRIEYQGDVHIETRPCHKFKVIDRFGIESFWYVDKDTYLMARLDYPNIDEFTGESQGRIVNDLIGFSNIGIIFPTKEVSSDGTNNNMINWTNNVSLNDSIFELPSINVSSTGEYLHRIAKAGMTVD